MIFERITIRNLFSYRRVAIDLMGNESAKNILLISGRNGFGKTSLLNSIKLLFHGPTKDIRETVQRDRDITIKQYVLGVGGDWTGIMNTNARKEGETRCWIRLEWRDENEWVEAQRTWYLEDKSEEELVGRLVIKHQIGEERQRLSGTDAQNFINQRLPREFMPFFFFDGEQITQLAEADDRQRSKQIERVLNISRFDKLTETLRSIEKNYKSALLSSGVFEKLEDLRRDRQKARRKIQDRDRQIADLESEIKELEARIRTRKKEKDAFFSRIQSIEKTNVDEELKRIEREQEEAGNQLIQLLPDIPLVANAALVDEANKELGSISNDENSSQRELLEELLEELPRAIFENRPQPKHVEEGVRQFYFGKLTRELENRIVNYSVLDDSLFQIDPSRAQTLQAFFRGYLNDKEKVSTRVRILEKIIANKRTKADLTHKAVNHAEVSEKERRAFAALEEELERLNLELGGRRAKLNDLNNVVNKKYLTQEIEAIETEITKLEQQVEEDQVVRRKKDVTATLRQFFDNHKRNLRKSIGDALEASINKHFDEIMTSHKQIERIELDHELFTWSFHNSAQGQVGKGNISAGMKQLAATAIIWALQEVSQANIPIIVDTPLARIDRAHQLELLTRYYPVAGRQVIVLPTDSELDREKYQILEPYIYREYKLRNIHGNNTTVKEVPMYAEVD